MDAVQAWPSPRARSWSWPRSGPRRPRAPRATRAPRTAPTSSGSTATWARRSTRTRPPSTTRSTSCARPWSSPPTRRGSGSTSASPCSAPARPTRASPSSRGPRNRTRRSPTPGSTSASPTSAPPSTRRRSASSRGCSSGCRTSRSPTTTWASSTSSRGTPSGRSRHFERAAAARPGPRRPPLPARHRLPPGGPRRGRRAGDGDLPRAEGRAAAARRTWSGAGTPSSTTRSSPRPGRRPRRPAFEVRECSAPNRRPHRLGNRQPAAPRAGAGRDRAPAGIGPRRSSPPRRRPPDLVAWTARGVEVWTEPGAPAARVGNLQGRALRGRGGLRQRRPRRPGGGRRGRVTLWANRAPAATARSGSSAWRRPGAATPRRPACAAGKPHAGGPETETRPASPRPRGRRRLAGAGPSTGSSGSTSTTTTTWTCCSSAPSPPSSATTATAPSATGPTASRSRPAAGARVTAAVRIDVVADSQAADLVVARSDGSAILYRDLLGGAFEARPLPALAALPGGVRRLLAADVDHDGWTDLVAAGDEGVTLLRNDHQEGFAAEPIAAQGDGPVALLDLDDRGANDLAFAVSAGTGAGPETGARSTARRGSARSTFPGTGAAGASSRRRPGQRRRSAGTPSALAAADFDGDGRTDLAAVDRSGTVRLLVNRTETDQHWSSGSASPGSRTRAWPTAPRSRSRRAPSTRRSSTTGCRWSSAWATRDEADTVRITWPNGLIQNEIRQPAGAFERYQEAPRLSGSCPMIFTWNGKTFQFITDVLGVAPLGASAGDGAYFPVDHDEGIRIPGSALEQRPDGRYEVRMTEELREVAYLDEIRLAAVDHPADVEILTNDKFKGPPFPELRLYGATDPLHPVAALDDQGRDVHERLAGHGRGLPRRLRAALGRHGRAPHADPRLRAGRIPGAGAPGALRLGRLGRRLDLPGRLPGRRSRSVGLVLPSLQVQDASGRWVTVLDDMGLPAGKPKTIVVDLTGLLPAGWRRLRHRHQPLRLLGRDLPRPDPRPAEHAPHRDPARAAPDLHFRGFSRVVIDPERKQPEHFVYAETRASTGASSLEPDPRPLHPLRPGRRAAPRPGRPLRRHGLGRRGAPGLRSDRPAAGTGGLDAGLPAVRRRLGQGRRRQHRLLPDRRAPAVPRHAPVPVRGRRTPTRATRSIPSTGSTT